MDTTKTFSETLGKEPINWWERLNRATTASPEELQQWKRDASDWVTCACGNQCSIIPRSGNGNPLDHRLRYLGIAFSNAIDSIAFWTPNFPNGSSILIDSLKAAKDHLTGIEKRSAELIQKILKNEGHELTN